MHASDERARGGWMEKQLEAELLRVGGPVALRAAQAEARGSAARRRTELLLGADRSDDASVAGERHDHLLEEELYARLDVLVRRVDLARRDPSSVDVGSTVPGPSVQVVPLMIPVVEPDVASVARVYDFALGGTNHYEVDRRAGYEIAREHRDRTRVVYVDNDPVVVAHGRALLSTARETTAIIRADLRDAASIFAHPETVRLIDTRRPFAVLASCVLHLLPDDADPPALLDTVKTFLTPGLVHADDWHPDPGTARDSPVHRLHLAGVGRVPDGDGG